MTSLQKVGKAYERVVLSSLEGEGGEDDLNLAHHSLGKYLYFPGM